MGKAAKKDANQKQKKNQAIADLVQHYYLTEQEMPEIIANMGASIGQQYVSQLNQAAVHIGVIGANMKEIEKEVKASSLSKAAKERITKWIDASQNKGDE